MKERLLPKELPLFRKLSPQLTSLLLKNPTNPDVIAKVESDPNMQAYLEIDPQVFGGLIYHKGTPGPEKPYFKPDATDWTPEVQAISRIGVQYQYWDMLHKALQENTIDPVQMISMELLYLHMNRDESSYIETSKFPKHTGGLEYIANKRNDLVPKYPTYVILTNYGGDADFYGSFENHIFPMDVKTSNNKQLYVGKETIGIPDPLVRETWDSWKELLNRQAAMYHQAVRSSWENLPPETGNAINSDLLKGVYFRGDYNISMSLMMNHKIHDLNLLETTRDIINNTARITMTGNPDLLRASKNHADNLHEMYETAKKYRSDIYHYR